MDLTAWLNRKLNVLDARALSIDTEDDFSKGYRAGMLYVITELTIAMNHIKKNDEL